MVVGVMVVVSVSVEVAVEVMTLVTETVSTIVVCRSFIVSLSGLSQKVEQETDSGKETAPIVR